MHSALPAQRRSADLPSAVAAALDAVDADRLVRRLQDVLAVPSVSGSDAESELQHRLAGDMTRTFSGVDLWRLDLPALVADPAFPGWEVPRTEAWGLVGEWGGEDGPTLVLNGHVDVVPPGDLRAWAVDPWAGEVRGGAVHGRGACDMKAGLVCQLAAVEALAEAGVRLRGRVQVQCVVGEEDGGLGAFATLRRGHRGDAALIAEPTSGSLVTAHAGALTFRLRVPGLSAHGSMRLAGVDAVEKYLVVREALRRLEQRRNRDADPLLERFELPYPLSVGTVRAGEWASTVPDLLVAEGRYGVALGEPVEDARAELEQAVAEACAGDPWLREHPVEVEWWGGQFASGRLPAGHPFADAVRTAHRATTGRDPAVTGVTYGSDLRLLSGVGGIPTLIYGPGDVRVAHSPEEHVPVREMVEVTRTLVLLAAQFCGTHDRARVAVR